jgi:hypothetical protein
MKPAEPDFSNHCFGAEMRELYSELQSWFGVSGPTAELIVRQAALDAQQMAADSKSVEHGFPIRFWAKWENSNSYALATVKLCPHPRTAVSVGAVRKLPLMLKQWVARIDAALCKNDEGHLARNLVEEKIEKCLGCMQWKVDGKITHLENCPDNAWEKITVNQKKQPSLKQQEHFKVSAAISTNKKKAKLGPSLNTPAPKKSKAHPQSSWPRIVPGGAVETKRRKF